MSTDDRPRPTRQWLEEMGAVRPMAPAGIETLTLGKLREGQYPITWALVKGPVTRDFLSGKLLRGQIIEKWRIFGIETREPLTKEDCERIMRSVRADV